MGPGAIISPDNARRLLTFSLGFFLLACDSDPVHAQGADWSGPLRAEPDHSRAQLKALGINIVLGASWTTARQLIKGRFSPSATLAGALGGGLAFTGKRVAAERFYGAGLVGRQVNAIGAALVGNAASDRGLLSTVAFPIGPVRIYVERSDKLRIQPKLDLASSIVTIYAATRPGMRWDPSASLSAGALVYRTRDRYGGPSTSAKHSAGVIWIEVDEDHWQADSHYAQFLIGHERVHVLQYDLAHHLIAFPLQESLVGWLPALAPVDQYVDLGLVSPFWALANGIIPYEHRPWEREAAILMWRPAIW